mgnify:CR=1 FL=1
MLMFALVEGAGEDDPQAEMTAHRAGGEVDELADRAGLGEDGGAGLVAGGRLGAGLVLSRGARFVRPIFLVVVSLTLLRLLWLNYR